MSLYDEISSNKWKSGGLTVFFFVFVVLVAWVIAWLLDFGGFAVVFAAILASLATLFSYYKSDELVLSMAGAHPADAKEFPYLHNAVEGLSIAAGIPKPKVYVIEDDSPNAFATGRDPQHAAVAVTTGLLKKLNRLELEGVLAHEISHIKNFDTRLQALAAIMVGFVIIASDFALRSMWFRGGGRDGGDRKGVPVILLFIGILFLVLSPLFAKLIQLAISRKREYLADASGAMLMRYPDGLINALRKISGDPAKLAAASEATAHLYIVNPLKGKFLENLFSTHPPIEERIQALRKYSFERRASDFK